MHVADEMGDGVAQLVESDSRSKTEVRTLSESGAQEKCVRVSPSQKCCADSLSLLSPTPVVTSEYDARIRMNTYARYRSCSPCQSYVDYGNTKRPSYYYHYY